MGVLLFVREALRERVHLVLQEVGVFDKPDLRVPGILCFAARRAQLLPGSLRGVALHFVDVLLDVVGHLQFRVHRGEQDEVYADFVALGLLRFDFPMGAKKDENVESDQCERGHWPATAPHIFVAQRNQHGANLST